MLRTLISLSFIIAFTCNLVHNAEEALEAVKSELGELAMAEVVADWGEEDRRPKACPTCGQKVRERLPTSLERWSDFRAFKRSFATALLRDSALIEVIAPIFRDHVTR